MQNELSGKRRKKIGDLLIEAGLIDAKTLAKALEIQKSQKKRLGQILIDMGVVDNEEVAKALAKQLMVPFLRLKNIEIPKEIISLVPAEMAENYLLIPIKKTKRRLLARVKRLLK